VLEELEEGGPVVLTQFGVLVCQSLAMLLVLELDGGGLENLQDHRLRLLLQEDVAQAQQSRQFLKLPRHDPLADDARKVLLVLLEEDQEHLGQPRRLLVLLQHEVGETGSQEQRE
jgi:hypothetical protein